MPFSKFSLSDFEKIVELRKKNLNDQSSYVAQLLRKGSKHIGLKVVEEAAEVLADVLLITKGHNKSKLEITGELADLFFNAIVLASSLGVSLYDIEKVFEERHRSYTIKQHSHTALQFPKFRSNAKPPFDLQRILHRYHISLPGTADIVLLSHHLRQKEIAGSDQICTFSEEAKTLKNQLTDKGLKVKMAVPYKKHENYNQRRSTDLALPLFVVLSTIALPTCVHLLAAYIKDWLDKHDVKSSMSTDLRIDIAVIKKLNQKETWYRIKGQPKEVYKAINKLQEITQRKVLS